MRAVSALPRMRARANSRMGASNGGSTGTIRRKVATVAEPAGEWTIPLGTAVEARIGGQWGAGTSKRLDIGPVVVQTANRVGSFPAGTPLMDDDYYEITAGELAGQVFRIVEADGANQQTALRVPVESVARPKEWT